MRRYVIGVLALSAMLFSLAVGFNWVVDPFDLWDSGRVTGLRFQKTEVLTQLRLVQVNHAFSSPVDTAIIGTSRSGIGLDSAHPAFGRGRTYNLAMAAQPAAESAVLAQRLIAGGTKRIVWGLDFFAFDCYASFLRDYEKNPLRVFDRSLPLFSISTLEASMSTLYRRSDSGDSDSMSVRFMEDGHLRWSRNVLLGNKGHRARAQRAEGGYLRSTYAPPFSLDCPNTGRIRPLEHYRGMLRLADRQGVGLRLFISPSHARLWETLAASGLWPMWEDWKRELVRINLEEAEKAGTSPFPIWDFSGFNSLTTEPFPLIGDTTEMHWYWESSHYKEALGNLVLGRVFDYVDSRREVPRDFGVRIGAENLEAHLTRIREDRENWRIEHPDDVHEIQVAAARERRIPLQGHK